MDSPKLVAELKSIIGRLLTPLIDSDYYLLEIPYYTNIGDTLIWQGELDFLKNIRHRCKGMYSLDTFTFPEISEKDVILFQGGGNFGDIWSKHHDFKLDVVRHYPKNKFIFFPQTVFFQSETEMRRSAEILGANKNITICARDQMSYNLLKAHFSNDILLVPDMAFCIDLKRHIKPFVTKSTENTVFVKRTDKELLEGFQYSLCNDNWDVSDWPTFITPPDYPTRALEKLKRNMPESRTLLALYANNIYRWYLIRTGVRFLSKYKTVVTTRLHAAILGVLLGKEVFIIDNSYGKNTGFFDTWLKGVDGVSIMS